ncbi:LysR family transcriptional regulator [Escherichia coli]
MRQIRHVSQPTLSGQIRKLEDELGVMLLERTSRKVLFTQAGMLLVDQARTVLREVKVLKEMASQQGETMSGPLHIGLIPDSWTVPATAYYPYAAPDLSKAGMYRTKTDPPVTGATGQRQTRLRDPRAGERERSIH